MVTPSTILAVATEAIKSNRVDHLPIIADMAEELGYNNEDILGYLRFPDPLLNNLHWWALKILREYYGADNAKDE